MKKFLAVLLAAMMVLSMATIASAETTTLTTTVPDATYTLNVPANQEIAFGEWRTEIGNVTITDSSNFARGKNVSVTVTYGDFTCADTTTTIPMLLRGREDRGFTCCCYIPSGDALKFVGSSTGTVSEKASMYDEENETNFSPEAIEVIIESEDWGKALAGEYTSTITFTAEVVVEE